jgi:hypothetical protein
LRQYDPTSRIALIAPSEPGHITQRITHTFTTHLPLSLLSQQHSPSSTHSPSTTLSFTWIDTPGNTLTHTHTRSLSHFFVIFAVSLLLLYSMVDFFMETKVMRHLKQCVKWRWRSLMW